MQQTAASNPGLSVPFEPVLDYAVATVIEGDSNGTTRRSAELDKHGLSIPEAATVFADPAAVYVDDGSGTDTMVVVGT